MLDFDDDILAGVETGLMDLGDGGRCHGRLVKVDEQLADRLAEFGFNRGRDCLEGIGGCVGLQVREFLGHLWADEVGAGTEHLAELDEGGAQFHKGHAHAFFAREVGNALAVVAFDTVLDPGIVPAFEPIGESVLREHADNFSNAMGISFQS